MNAFVERATGEVLSVWTESYTVDGFLMTRQSMNVASFLDVPQSHGGVERRTAKTFRCLHLVNPCASKEHKVMHVVEYSSLPSKDEVSVGVLCSRTGWTPLDRVDFFVVSAQVVNAVILLQTPDLQIHVYA